MWDLGVKPGPPALGALSLSPWTTRKVPASFQPGETLYWSSLRGGCQPSSLGGIQESGCALWGEALENAPSPTQVAVT